MFSSLTFVDLLVFGSDQALIEEIFATLETKYSVRSLGRPIKLLE